jgi:hypothetical protein
MQLIQIVLQESCVITKILSKGLGQFLCCLCVRFLFGKMDYYFYGLIVGVHTRPADDVIFYIFIETPEPIKGLEEFANTVDLKLDRPGWSILVVDTQPIFLPIDAAVGLRSFRSSCQHRRRALATRAHFPRTRSRHLLTNCLRPEFSATSRRPCNERRQPRGVEARKPGTHTALFGAVLGSAIGAKTKLPQRSL